VPQSLRLPLRRLDLLSGGWQSGSQVCSRARRVRVNLEHFTITNGAAVGALMEQLTPWLGEARTANFEADIHLDALEEQIVAIFW
jgi:hypothetical protein